ncbi:MAG: Inner membrane protein YrbG, predicted calcium/sodium:proton antiporter [Candidatus Collierbacteria bacterium GW2011_GWA2_46_26]|uniref:Inner membrane protein YrbG, predicted calcium/sodium:proton antiporter n=1 Tax=Candidatus Collierbacteria bacterium GW2011_GWA2_46_26 TaxID=1618381 RepID=A0A0G1RUK9_9BACT|nr:MAG: Inner membrane protein YrbG, predicted calcium/sodium:proton antiporter [Candidatus Collierbacteria bacterium GW2011_GWC2_44_13]KKU33643.1 MAG: Inner membrane protein YrbG, predicted calcium/sodium:proton antiporter [Candidatus Collierbacteria bacterium GW2011_GWA2_46_26]
MWLNEGMLLDILYGVTLILIMVIASGATVGIFEKLAHDIRTNRLMLASVLVGFSTSLPELFVGVAAALRGQPQIALGDIVGANLANLSWIIGGAALVFGSVPVIGDYLRKELWVTMGIAMFPFILISDGKLSRFDGLVLVLLYFIYVNNLVRNGNSPLKHLKLSGRKPVVHRLKTRMEPLVETIKLVVGLGVLGVCAWMLINVVIRISSSWGVSPFWVGLVILATGTTLPELVLTIVASEKREISLILGNVLGSVVVNSTLILGIISLISPIVYVESLQRGISGLFLLIVLGLFWLFTKTKHKLDRWEGAVLVGVYAMFVGIQLMLA